MNKKTVYGILLALSLSALIYFSESPEKILGTYNNLETEVDIRPFAVAKGANTTIFDKEGAATYTFTAARLEHYRAENESGEDAQAEEVFTLVERPKLVFYQDDEPWLVIAQKGKMTSADQKIELWQEVLVKHVSKTGITTQINTEKLVIDPVSRFANTDEPVKILSDRIELEGVGMTADFNKEKIRLLSNVHGIHDPT